MIQNLCLKKNSFKWMFLHVALGVSCSFIPWLLIVWFYIVLISSINKIISDLFFRNYSQFIIPLIVYLVSFEVFGRMLKSSPLIPWELSKYLIISCSLILILTRKSKIKTPLGIFLILLLIPGLLIDKSNSVNFSGLVFSAFGAISLGLLIVIIGNNKIKDDGFDSILRLIWYSSVSMLIYVILKTPNYSDLKLSLNANFSTSGGFGSNQVSTILGVGLFLSFYAWMNKLRFSGKHNLDAFFIGIFAYQGFSTFSRGGMFTGLLSMLIYYILFTNSINYKNFVKTRRLKPLVLFGFALLLTFLSYLAIETISGGNLNLRYQGETKTTLSGDKIKTINTITTGRYNILKEDMILWGNNLIFGTGAGASTTLRGNGLDQIASHTELSRLLSEHGIFGFFYFLLLLITFFKNYMLNRKTVGSAIIFVIFFIGVTTSMHSAMRTFVSPIFIALSTMIIIETQTNDI